MMPTSNHGVSVMFSRLKDAVAKADDRAQLGIAGARERSRTAPCTTFFWMGHKRECCGEIGGTDVGISSKEKVEATIADPKLDVSQSRKGVDSLGETVYYSPRRRR
jgi:hypothetical protein